MSKRTPGTVPKVSSISTDDIARRWDNVEEIARALDRLLERGHDRDVLAALRRLTKHFGGVAAVAQAAGLNRTFLYRMLSRDGNPEMRTVEIVLRTMGLRLGIRPVDARRPRRRAARKRAPA